MTKPAPANVAPAGSPISQLFASVQSFTASGTARFRELMAEADGVAQAARCMMIPAKEQIHVAH